MDTNMNSNKKLLIIVAAMLLFLMSAVVINVSINFRDYSFKSALDKANSTAMFVKDGLTAHMVDGTIDKREFFLHNIRNHKNINDLWVIRGENVNQQFGNGFANEKPRDAMDKQVLQTGKMHYQLNETSDKATIRVTIPYIATAYGTPNCLECHNAKEGDVLGAISMEFDIMDARYEGISTITKIVVINLIFLVIALFLINYFFKPITNLFNELENMIKLAHQGDFSKRITLKTNSTDNKAIMDQMNNLFDKLESTFKDIKDSLAIFVSKSNISYDSPIQEAKEIIHELSDIYKFKKTIELDKDDHDIITRISSVLEHKFQIENYKIYIIKKDVEERILEVAHGDSSMCDCSSIDTNSTLCRAYRTGIEVSSVDFNNICQYCQTKENVHYLCIPFDINNEISMVISIFSDDLQQFHTIQTITMNIKNYLDAAKPVLESKYLMKKLEESSLKDGLTGLYNRRFLESFIEKFTKQADRANLSYAILMIDIDYFKMVNDTYGHDVGDMVIKELSYILKTTIRGSDIAIRYGGEEFLVLLYNPEKSKVMEIATKIAIKFKDIEFQTDKESFRKTLSIGISYFPQQADSIWKAIKFADTALYKAKESGRDKIVEFTPDMYSGDWKA
jgi:diguanylate cyclase (GGDEF)-like protein